jgi:hypothetical protein
MDDGTAVVGVSATSEQVLAVKDGAKSWALNLGAAFVTAAPAVGANKIWIGSEDYSLYGIELDGSGLAPGVAVATDGAINGSVAVLPQATKEWAFVTSNSGRVGAASTVANEYSRSPAGDACTAGAVIGLDGRIYAASATSTATVRSFAFDGAFTPKWTVEVGVSVSAPLAIDGDGNVWTGSLDAKLVKTTPSDLSGSSTTFKTLPGSVVDSPVFLAGGDIVVGDQSGALHRFTPTGAQVWGVEPNFGVPSRASLVLAGGDAALIVPAGGKVVALRGDGTESWSNTLDIGTLRAPNIYTVPGQTGNAMSTVYLASSTGKLFAVIVDGQLDASAPWPKAFHDPKNTNRAGPQP